MAIHALFTVILDDLIPWGKMALPQSLFPWPRQLMKSLKYPQKGLEVFLSFYEYNCIPWNPRIPNFTCEILEIRGKCKFGAFFNTCYRFQTETQTKNVIL